jgi:glyoxylase-like metal-dependent hydrolase (beta-lactamase superfamily II)
MALKNKYAFSIILIVILLSSLLSAQEKLPEIKLICLSGHLYKILIGPVSVVASIGPDGVLLSDTGFESTGLLLKSNLKKLGGHHIRYIINTHWHSDHCNGNKVFGKEAPVIIAHENVLQTLSEDQILSVFWQEEHKSFPEYARPNITFSHRLTVYFNDEQIKIIHFPNGHTDGDAIVYFKKAKVVHMGDLLFSNGFPAIDFEHGGSAEQWTINLQEIIDMMPADVKFIAGHGPDYTLEKLKKYREMILSTVAIVKKEIEKGRSLDEMKKDKILAGWEEWANGIHSCNEWIEIVYHSLTFNKGRNKR